MTIVKLCLDTQHATAVQTDFFFSLQLSKQNLEGESAYKYISLEVTRTALQNTF